MDAVIGAICWGEWPDRYKTEQTANIGVAVTRRLEAARTQLWGKVCALSVRGVTASVHAQVDDRAVTEVIRAVQDHDPRWRIVQTRLKRGGL